MDVTQNLAGPFCTQTLGDLGADVIKIEPPAGDPSRAWGPPFQDGQSTIFLAANRNKRSLALDLRHPEARMIVRRLAAGADVFVESLRPGAAAGLGLGPESLRALNPGLIHCSVTAYGSHGPLADLPGYDPLMQAHAGLMSVTGRPGDPVRIGVSVVDIGTGLWAALAVVTALRERDRTGAGATITTSLFETALVWSAYHLMGFWATGAAPGPMGTSFPLIAPYGAFPTSDGHLMVAAASDGLFQRLCGALDLDGPARDERFRDNPSRLANRAALTSAIEAVTKTRPTRRLEAELRAAGVPCAPILDMAGVAAESQTEACGVVDRTPHPRVPGYASVGLPVRFDGVRAGTRLVPPLTGEHGAGILAELGYDGAAIGRMERAGVFGNKRAAGDVESGED